MLGDQTRLVNIGTACLPGALCNVFYKVKSIAGNILKFQMSICCKFCYLKLWGRQSNCLVKELISHTSSFSQISATDGTMESNMEGVQNLGLAQSTFCPNIDPLENR